jgi:hypothetical protein
MSPDPVRGIAATAPDVDVVQTQGSGETRPVRHDANPKSGDTADVRRVEINQAAGDGQGRDSQELVTSAPYVTWFRRRWFLFCERPDFARAPVSR